MPVPASYPKERRSPSPYMTDVTVRSNLDALNANVLHEAFESMVRTTAKLSEDFLRADRAGHSRSGLTVEHIGSDIGEIVDGIEAHVGISAVREKDDRPTHGRYRHSQAPIFVDAGTHSPIFGVTGDMWNLKEGILGRKSVSGQTGQRFMAKTFAEALLYLHADKQVSAALAAMEATAQAEKAAIEAE